jgi:hypothetical protein
MTGVLKQTMDERADRLGGIPVDLEAITREGDRRVRRRRSVTAGVAGVLVTAAIMIPFVVNRDTGGVPDDRDRVAVGTAPRLSYAVGSVIHHDGRTTDVGHRVRAFVATGKGFVSVDPKGVVWSTVGSQTTQVGKNVTGSGRVLVGDGDWVGWVERPRDATPTFVFVNQAEDDGLTIAESDAEHADQWSVRAIDGDTAYYQTSRGTLSQPLVGRHRATTLSTDDKVTIDDVEDGVILFEVEGPQGRVRTYAGTDLADRGTPLKNEGGDLSPGATHVMSENSATRSDDFTLRRLDDGADAAPKQEQDYGFFLGYAWVDDDTYTAFGIASVADEGATTIDLLTCSAADRRCEVEKRDLDWKGIQFPIGEHVGS